MSTYWADVRAITSFASASAARSALPGCAATTLIVTSGAPVARAPGPDAPTDRGADIPAQRAERQAGCIRRPSAARSPSGRSRETARGFVRKALHRRAAVRRERLAHRDERLRLVDLAAAEREPEADHGPEHEPEHRQPPARGDALPDRAEVDLALGVGIGDGFRAIHAGDSTAAHPTAPGGRPRATWSAASRGRRGSASCPPSCAAGRRPRPRPARARGAARDALEQRDRLVHGRLLAAADVVDRAGLGALHREHARGDDVADVGEAAALLAVAEERERTPLEQRLDDARERHVRPLPGPVGVEVAEDDRVEPEARRGRAREVLAGELRDPVGRERPRRRLLRRRVSLRLAVDRRRGGEDDTGAGRGRPPRRPAGSRARSARRRAGRRRRSCARPAGRRGGRHRRSPRSRARRARGRAAARRGRSRSAPSARGRSSR